MNIGNDALGPIVNSPQMIGIIEISTSSNIDKFSDYNSENTRLLEVNEIITLLKKTPPFKELI